MIFNLYHFHVEHDTILQMVYFLCGVQVHCLALEMVGDGVSLDSVQLLLSLANTVHPHKLSVVDIVSESLRICLKELEQPQ